MIQGMKLVNFQSHKETNLSFDKGVNIIIGSSDSGKTAILRALTWVVNNKPGGNSFRSYWDDNTKVIVLFGDDSITREKSKQRNGYSFDGEIYTGMNQSVPEKLAKLMNMTDINIQYQLDGPFLLSKSSGEIAKYLNKIVNLDKIDSALTNIGTEKRAIKRDELYITEEIKNKNKELEDYSNLDLLDIKIKKLEGVEKEIKDKEEKAINVKHILSNIKTIKKNIKSFNFILKKESKINACLDIIEKVKGKEKEKRELTVYASSITDTKNILSTVDKTITNGEFKLNKLEKLVLIETDISNIIEKRKSIEKIIEEIKRHKTLIKSEEKDLQQLIKEYEDAMPDICPLCEQEIKK